MTKYKYYKHLVFRETPYAPTKGRNPISEEMAMNENHFKLTYDHANRLMKVEYRMGEQLINPKRAGIMDAMHDVAPLVQIEYSGNLEIRHFFDEQGNPTSNQMKVYKAVYEYDDAGERIGLKHFDKDDKPMDSAWGVFEYIWEKVSEDSMLEKRKNAAGDFVSMRPYYLFMNVLHTYDKNGMLTSMKNVDSAGALVDEETGIAIDEPVYDEHFQLTAFKFYNKNEEHVMGSFLSAASGEIKYDSKGNAVKYIITDLEGKPTPTPQKWAFTETDFDQYGNMTEVRYYDKKGIPVATNHSTTKQDFTKVKFIYDENNLTLKPEIVFE